MAAPVDLSRVSFIVLREMRRPIMTLIVVYSVSVLGMVFIPGPVIDGKTQYMSIFHAFYFMTYTATTTGFGEIPFEFSNAQRFWAIACLYVSVIAWFYAIGSIIRLVQNPFFLRAMAEVEFSWRVRRIPGPFFIVCGFGDTGSLLARGLSDAGLPAAIIESDQERIKALQLRNYRVPMPGLCADASVPKHLLDAGLRRPNCKGVVAITNDEEVNLKISALARLLNPNVGIITQSKVEVFEETLATLGGEVHIVDPFKTYARVLAAAMQHPGFYALNNWLVGEKGASLDKYIHPPLGKWVICGYGRMGHEVNDVLTGYGLKTAVIDPHEDGNRESLVSYIVGRTTAKTLQQAGVEQAAGILAGTDDDGHNLGIILNARSSNERLFCIARQNRHENEVAFKAAGVDMIMQPSLVTARRILFLLTAPLLKSFFSYLMEDKPGRRELMEEVIERLRTKIGDRKKPYLGTIDFNREKAVAIIDRLNEGGEVRLGEIIRDPRNRDRQLSMLVMVAKSGDETYILPGDELPIKEGDQMLFCGTQNSRRLLNSTLNNEYNLYYLQTGDFKPRGYFWQWYRKKREEMAGRPEC